MNPAPFNARLRSLEVDGQDYVFELAGNGQHRLDVYVEKVQKVYVLSLNPDHSTVVDHGYFGTSLSVEGLPTTIDIPVKRSEFVDMMEKLNRAHSKPKRMRQSAQSQVTGLGHGSKK